MNLSKKSDGELKMLAHDFHNNFETPSSDSLNFRDGYLNEVVKELINRDYTISLHTTLVIDK